MRKSIITTIHEHGKTITDVARDAGLTRDGIYKMSKGDPRLSSVVKLARASGIKPSVLFPELGEPDPVDPEMEE